jgi:hypothetical protein
MFIADSLYTSDAAFKLQTEDNDASNFRTKVKVSRNDKDTTVMIPWLNAQQAEAGHGKLLTLVWSLVL